MNYSSVPSFNLVQLAYRLLKQDTDYDKMDLFLRVNIAAYEASDSFQQRQDALAAIGDELRKEGAKPEVPASDQGTAGA